MGTAMERPAVLRMAGTIARRDHAVAPSDLTDYTQCHDNLNVAANFIIHGAVKLYDRVYGSNT